MPTTLQWQQDGLMLALLSYVPVSNALLAPLEHRFPPLLLSPSSSSHDLALSARWVVVLGGGFVSDPELPTTSQLTEGSLVRLIEGIRLYRQIPGSTLLLSGGAVFDRVAEAEGLDEWAELKKLLRGLADNAESAGCSVSFHRPQQCYAIMSMFKLT